LDSISFTNDNKFEEMGVSNRDAYTNAYNEKTPEMNKSERKHIQQDMNTFCITRDDITIENKKDSKISTPVKSFVNTYNRNKKEKKDLSQSNISNLSDEKCLKNKSIISNASFIKCEKPDFNKIYSKREKAELHMARGIPKDIKKYEANTYKCDAYQFLRPTSIILDTDKYNIDRYKPSTEFFKNSVIQTKLEFDRFIDDDRESNITNYKAFRRRNN
jgi:hypothetical protein